MSRRRRPNPASEPTRPTFLEAINKLIDAWNNYHEDRETFWNAVDAAGEAQPKTPMAASEPFGVHAAFLAFQRELEAYDMRQDETAEPHAEFWRALDEIHVAHTQPSREPPRPESIAVLTKQNVPPTQICAIWGLVDEHGRPQIAKIEQEQAELGSVIGDAYEWPTLRRFREEQVQRYAQYLSLLIEKHGHAKGERPPCRETPEELYRQGVGESQAAKMLCVSADEVAAKWKKFAATIGPPDQTVPVTDERGEQLPEFVATTRIESPANDRQQVHASSAYSELDENELRELCAASELSIEGTRDEMIFRLEEQDRVAQPA